MLAHKHAWRLPPFQRRIFSKSVEMQSGLKVSPIEGFKRRGRERVALLLPRVTNQKRFM